MAMCEKCSKGGYYPQQMSIDNERDQFVGPCCATPTCVPIKTVGAPAQVHVLPAHGGSKEVEYGIEISNKVGVHAWVNYQGLEVSFERSPAELKTWAERQGLVEKTGT